MADKFQGPGRSGRGVFGLIRRQQHGVLRRSAEGVAIGWRITQLEYLYGACQALCLVAQALRSGG